VILRHELNFNKHGVAWYLGEGQGSVRNDPHGETRSDAVFAIVRAFDSVGEIVTAPPASRFARRAFGKRGTSRMVTRLMAPLITHSRVNGTFRLP
jgi:hypothetical protein